MEVKRKTKLFKEINEEKDYYNSFNALKQLWVIEEESIALAVYHSDCFENANTILEYVDGGESIEYSIFDVMGKDWCEDHCLSSIYLNTELLEDIIYN